MAYCFNLFLIIALLVFQTSFAPNFKLFYGFFNLMSLFVLYLVLYRPHQEIIVFILLAGVLMDSSSSCPFGLYTTIYIWLSLGIKWTLKYLHKENVIIIPMIFSGVILVENFFIMSGIGLIDNDFSFHPEKFRSLIYQLMYGVFLGPLIILWIKKLHAKWNSWSFEKIFKHFG